MKIISQSVGRGGRARRGSDVLQVQKLLNQAGAKPQVAMDGIIGPATIRAIEQFQRSRRPTLKLDGRVDPGGKTIRHLMGPGYFSHPFALEFPAGSSKLTHFRKFDYASKGNRSSESIRSLVLRDGLANRQASLALKHWMKEELESGGGK